MPGFTLLELLIVIAVPGILGALATSAFRTYSVRAQIADGIQKAASWQRRTEHAFQPSGQVPTDTWQTDVPAGSVDPPSPYVDSVEVVDGRLDLTYGRQAHAAIAGRRLSLTPYETAGQEVVWVCGNEIPGPGLKPLGFVGGGRQAVQIPTTVDARYLPPTCR
jgi:type IV pilus assembly protein PilA